MTGCTTESSFFAKVINCILHGNLPTDRNQAHRVLVQVDVFYNENNQLFLLAIPSRKQLALLTPRSPQLMISKARRKLNITTDSFAQAF